MKRNFPIFGLIIGLLLPLLGFYIVYLLLFEGTTLSGFFSSMVSNPKVASKVLSLGILINLIPFVYYTNKRLDLTARGLFVATMLYVVFILLIRFAWT
jgi:amino acid permease